MRNHHSLAAGVDRRRRPQRTSVRPMDARGGRSLVPLIISVYRGARYQRAAICDDPCFRVTSIKTPAVNIDDDDGCGDDRPTERHRPAISVPGASDKGTTTAPTGRRGWAESHTPIGSALCPRAGRYDLSTKVIIRRWTPVTHSRTPSAPPDLRGEGRRRGGGERASAPPKGVPTLSFK